MPAKTTTDPEAHEWAEIAAPGLRERLTDLLVHVRQIDAELEEILDDDWLVCRTSHEIGNIAPDLSAEERGSAD